MVFPFIWIVILFYHTFSLYLKLMNFMLFILIIHCSVSIFYNMMNGESLLVFLIRMYSVHHNMLPEYVTLTITIHTVVYQEVLFTKDGKTTGDYIGFHNSLQPKRPAKHSSHTKTKIIDHHCGYGERTVHVNTFDLMTKLLA